MTDTTSTQPPVTADDTTIRAAARRLENASIWVRRDIATDANGLEVPTGHPTAVNTDYHLEVDFERIVRLVVGYLNGDPDPTPDPS